VLAGLLTASVAVAGCGTADSSAGSGGSASESASNKQDAARVKLQQCLSKQGVDLPGPGGGGGAGQRTAADRQKLQAAMQGPCKALRAAAFGTITDAERQQFQDAFTKYAACMRQQGVDLPVPTAGGGGPPAGAARLDRSDPKVKAAAAACQDKRPQRPGGRPGGAGS
ncbi:MAG: hypothetical protein QOE31_3181, partial [Solirubrobacteraceae bacterium]|nr:hypothetical protein [Solirubrobacteraceae bacterium]